VANRALIDSVQSGDRKALARAITLVEHGGELGPVESPRTPVVGVTGPPGVGKSTLISAMIASLRGRGETVAVLAVDPSSPLTGGALLGDRIRMQGHVDDPGVYIRSMATRGHLGGLAGAAADALGLMRLAGFDRVIVETVGVGQSEVEVMGVADTVVLVVGPSWGDHVQADKAGVIEIADVIVINKADRPGIEEVKRALAETAGDRGVEVILTTATTGDGVDALLEAVDRR
jgi:LAO/AO transport system kinase